MIPISPKAIGVGTAAILIVGLVAGALWQANKLIKAGKELARLEAENADLREQVEEKAHEIMGLIDSYETKVAMCFEQVRLAQEASERWRARVAELENNPIVVERTVTIQASDCVDALVEGRGIVRARLAEVDHAIPD